MQNGVFVFQWIGAHNSVGRDLRLISLEESDVSGIPEKKRVTYGMALRRTSIRNLVRTNSIQDGSNGPV